MELATAHTSQIVQQDACKVVNPEDSTISSDHLGMAKFDDPSDPNYQIVVKRLKHMYSYKDTSASSSIATRNFSAHMMSFDTQMSAFSATAPVRTGTNDSQISCPDAREEILASGNVEVKLALALEDQGSYKEAEQAYRDAIDNLTDLRGETDRFTLYCMDKLASLLRDRSRYDEAAALAKKVLVARIEQLGLESSTTLSSAGNLALIMRYQNKQQAAFSMLRNALEANDTPPLSSITRTRIASVLAKIYRDHGAYDAAELLSRDVARACSLWLGDEHPFTLNRQSDLSVAYSTCEGKNRYLVAEDLARQTLDGLERNLGRDHPNALRTSKRLGNYLRFEGDCEHAAKRLEMTYLRMKEQLGFHHPGTLSALTSFAAASAAQGYVEEARRNFNDALKDQVELLGCDHPNTLWTIQALEHLDKMDPKTGGEQASSSLGASDTEWFLTPSRIQHKVSLEPVPVFWDSIHSADRALIDAIGSNNENMVKDVLSEVTDQDTLGRGLRVAAYSGRERIVRTLLEHGAPVNSSGGYYGTALQAASSSGHVATVEFLLEMNADANVQGGLLNTPLRAAVFEGWRGIAQTLLDNGADVNVHGESSSILQVAVGRHDTEMVRMILERGAMANATDHLFGSALQEASFHGDEEIVSLLIQYGADPNLAGGLYGSAMQAALRASQRGTVKLLMEAGADASSYNMLNAILESGMDLGEVSFGRHTSDLFVMEPKFSAKADVHSLRFSMRTRTLRSKGSQHEQQERQQHEESKGSTTAEVTRRAEYTQRSRSPIRPRTPKEGKVKQGRDSSKVRGKGFSRHLKILGR
jgi:ankyrin repeat protein/tetratricopeptide (TPR) repeat protein